MAKRSANNRTGRDVNTFSSHRYGPAVPRFTPRLVSPQIATFEDRRTYHPAGPNRPAFSLPRSASRLVVRQKPSSKFWPSQTKGIVTFAVPKNVSICVKRSVRKQVLHALGKAGKSGMAPRRRSAFSSVSCR